MSPYLEQEIFFDHLRIIYYKQILFTGFTPDFQTVSCQSENQAGID